jgi:hypothetical protein
MVSFNEHERQRRSHDFDPTMYYENRSKVIGIGGLMAE